MSVTENITPTAPNARELFESSPFRTIESICKGEN